MKVKDFVLYCIGIHGELAGLCIIIGVSIFDLMMLGLRGYMEYSIGFKGIVSIWIAVILICLSKHLDRTEW